MTSTITAKQPDISYHPDVDKWTARTTRRLEEDPSLPLTPLPDGFPKCHSSPRVWEGSDFSNESQWVYKLSPVHLGEIKAAVSEFKESGLHFGYVSTETFPLPTLGPILKTLTSELFDGRGFFVLRGIPVDTYSREDNVLIFTGLASHIGNKRGLQRLNGSVISHITDLTLTRSKIGFPAYTTEKQAFHTDGAADIVALFALETAAEGGTSRICSTTRVYNELAEKRPDLIKTLSEPWPFDTFGQEPSYREWPLLHHIDGHTFLSYARRYFTGYEGLPRSDTIPPITEAQAEALDTIHFLGEKYSLGMNFTKGDIQFINNLAVIHARDGFKDSPDKKRHLLRLLLRNEEQAWKLPDVLKTFWDKKYGVEQKDQVFALEPGSLIQ